MAQPSVTGSAEAWQRVADFVRERRLELGLGQGDLGVSKSVASNVENGKQRSYARASLARITRALAWSPDSIEAILRGDEPRAAGRAAGGRDGGARAGVGEELERLAGHVAELTDEIAALRRLIERRGGLALAAAGGDVRSEAAEETARPRPGDAPAEQPDL